MDRLSPWIDFAEKLLTFCEGYENFDLDVPFGVEMHPNEVLAEALNKTDFKVEQRLPGLIDAMAKALPSVMNFLPKIIYRSGGPDVRFRSAAMDFCEEHPESVVRLMVELRDYIEIRPINLNDGMLQDFQTFCKDHMTKMMGIPKEFLGGQTTS